MLLLLFVQKPRASANLPPLDAYATRCMSHVPIPTQPACAYTLLPVHKLHAKAV